MLVLFFTVSCSLKESFQIKERKAGVGFRYGANAVTASLAIPDTNDNSSLIGSDSDINSSASMRFPLFLKLDE